MTTVIESSDASDQDMDQISKKRKIATRDSDIEVVENTIESPEEELGKLFKMLIYKYMVTYLVIFKNEWQRIGPRQSMDFSMRVRELR
jgi:hypothetical protein